MLHSQPISSVIHRSYEQPFDRYKQARPCRVAYDEEFELDATVKCTRASKVGASYFHVGAS